MRPNYEGYDTGEDTDFSITSLATDSRRRPMETRRLINLVSIVLVVALIVGTVPWWSGAAQDLWQRVFPPGPYSGALVFADSLAVLQARAATDGHVVWQHAAIPQNSVFYRDGATLYILPTGQQRLIAVRVSDGHQLWEQPMSASNIAGTNILAFLGNTPTLVYLSVNFTADDTVRIFTFDKRTGGPVSEMAGLCFATLAVPALIMAACQADGAEHVVTSVDAGAAQGELWQQLLPGRGIRAVVQGTLLIDVAYLPGGQGLHLAALDRQTGAIVWETNTFGGVPYFGPTAIIVESNPFDGSGTPDRYMAIDAATGAQLWSLTRPGTNGPLFLNTAHANADSFTLDEQTLVATDERTGATRWSLPTAADAPDIQSWHAELDAQTLYFADRTQLLAVDAVTGKVRWHHAEGGHVPTSLALGEGNLYEVAGNQLLARDPQNGTLRWQQGVTTSAAICAACNGATGP